ncbi:MAG TPA: VWA domain-containing protein [Terriglobales bacterium]|nr:VWA domain-containing protein [Terriglobales bacterium]
MKRSVRHLVYSSVVFSALALSLFAQKPVTLKGQPVAQSGQAQSTDTDAEISFRSYSRMVVVDVIVKDSNGRPVKGLTADDFQVFEDGVPQRLNSFNENSSHKVLIEAPKRETLAWEDIYSNTKPKDANLARPSIILLDLLNTPAAERAIARAAIMKFLKDHLKRDEPLAIFVLTSKLQLLQDFTTDAGLLVKSAGADRRATSDPTLDRSNSEMVADIAFGEPLLRPIATALVRMESEVQADRTTARVGTTLEALRSISRYAERSRGRKSLVWLSAGFPFALQTNMGLSNFETELRQTANQISTSQLAIYPVDVRGMVNNADWIAAAKPEPFQGRQQMVMNTVVISQDSMKEIAELTGGIAFMNRNDLDVAIAAALEDNRESYMLGYYPVKKSFDNRFRRIRVKLKNRNVAELRHRSGYYALGFNVEKQTTPDLLKALENDASTSDQIPLLSKLTPVAPTAGVPFRVELFVQGGNIHYTDISAKAAAFLDFAVTATTPNGKTVARTWHRGELKLDAPKALKAQKSGLLYSLPMTLPVGQYTIRAGVRDSFTGRIGSIEFPLVVK